MIRIPPEENQVGICGSPDVGSVNVPDVFVAEV
jgi:hypothetical protein